VRHGGQFNFSTQGHQAAKFLKLPVITAKTPGKNFSSACQNYLAEFD